MKQQLKKIKEKKVFDNYLMIFFVYRDFYRSMGKEESEKDLRDIIENETRYLSTYQGLNDFAIKEGIKMAQKYLN